MPIYGYHCDECGHELEIFQSMSDAPLKTCPVCGGSLRKLLYPVGVQFKGSGFYTTDYRNGGSKSAGKSSDGPFRSEGESQNQAGHSGGPSGEKLGANAARQKSGAPAAQGGD